MIIILMLAFLVMSSLGQPNLPEKCQGYLANKTFTKETQLLECLLTNYKTDVRPAIDQSQHTQINISFYLIAVAQVRDKENSMSIESFIGQQWFDHRLKWNPDEWGGIKKLFAKYYYVWEPELLVWDRQKNNKVEGAAVVIKHTGVVEWESQVRLDSFCRMTYEKFPFDRQSCIIYLQHQVYDSDLVDTKLIYPTTSKMPGGTCYSLKDEWKVDECLIKVERSNYDEMNTTYMTLGVILDRQYSYHVHLIIIPSIFVVLITLLLFWLPHESNQRFMTAGGIMFVIFLMNFLLQQFLPPGLGSVPTIASYLLYCIFLLMAVITISLITRNLHSKDPREEVIPEIIKKIFFNVVALKATFVTSYVSMPNVSVENKAWNEPIQRGDPFSPGSGGGDPKANAFGQSTEKLLEDIRKHIWILLNTPDKTTRNEWKQLALIIDRLSFYIFFFLTSSSALPFMLTDIAFL